MDRSEIADVLDLVHREALQYLAELDDRPVRHRGAAGAAASFDGALPDQGIGAAPALRELIERGRDAVVGTAGPRAYHFVISGTTPAALGADWLASAFDQVAYAWVTSPLATQLEKVSLDWLRELFDLPIGFRGLMTTGATMANFVGLAAGRQWCGERLGVDVGEAGVGGVDLPVFSSGYLHASTIKALSMLGLGRGAARKLARDAIGRLDVDALRRALDALDGRPAILVGNAGEVNAGDFDPIETLADLAEQHDCWLHVDGAFGLFARCSPRTAALAAGAERAQSITVDGHKWLNVPYDCGFAFVRDTTLLGRAFHYAADYLPDPDDPHPNFGSIGPESSRRARSLAVWTTLRAYGRAGYRAMIEGHLDLAQHLARRIDAATDFERLADVPLNIVCFRYRPAGVADARLDELNDALGEALVADGRFYVGTTRYDGRVALRPALVNWRTRAADLDAFVEVVREVGERTAASLRLT